MERLPYSCRCAVSVELANQLREKGSWCGETHLQKAMYILQDLSKSNFGYKFVIYKHGPYSFDFSSELSAMRAADIFEFRFPQQGYGPSIVPTEFGAKIREIQFENIREFEEVTRFLADWFAGHDVRYLEKIATAYFITTKSPRLPAKERADKLHSLKPHIDISSAEEAVRVVDEKRELAAKQLALKTPDSRRRS